MSQTVNVAVIGGGIFGTEIALKAKSLGLSVKVCEAKGDVLSGASMNNQNRLHLGFHYPRDLETGLQSIRGFNAFREKYAECIQADFSNAYVIANKNSLTSISSYLDFCQHLGLPFQEISASSLPVRVAGADRGVLCDELVYDCRILRDLVWQNLRREGVEVVLGDRVVQVSEAADRYCVESLSGNRILADVVVNASYGDINRITEQLGFPIAENLYEYTAVPIIKLDIPRVGITIMDGPFMTLLPHGKSGNFLLYNVVHSVVASGVSRLMDASWQMPESAPFGKTDKFQFFRKMIELCAEYVPALERAELVGFLEGPRMVLARKEASDARPSIVNNYNDRYFSVFAGKIDHSIWVADEVGSLLKRRFDVCRM
jgi:glycine/D-amino acid oxidase-like deaminating enzyme